jgi:hypothetical protein
LVRRLFDRFFDGESLSSEAEPERNIVQLLGFLAVPSAFFIILRQPIVLTRRQMDRSRDPRVGDCEQPVALLFPRLLVRGFGRTPAPGGRRSGFAPTRAFRGPGGARRECAKNARRELPQSVCVPLQ